MHRLSIRKGVDVRGSLYRRKERYYNRLKGEPRYARYLVFIAYALPKSPLKTHFGFSKIPTGEFLKSRAMREGVDFARTPSSPITE